MALDGWLSDDQSYAALLLGLRRFHLATERRLERIGGWDRLTPRIDLVARRRALRIDADLAELDVAVPAPLQDVDVRARCSIADGLGCLYVIEGAALGGRVIAARARAALGPHVPTTFFADPTRDVAREWKELRTTLDAFGVHDPARADAVLSSAHRTFEAFAAMLMGLGRSAR